MTTSIKNLLPRFSVKLVLAFAVLVTALVFLPSRADQGRAEACPNPPTVPTFNPYPVTFADNPGDACVDFPLIKAKLSTGQYPQNESERNAGVDAQAGDEVEVLIYFHNGAISNGDPNVTTAQNARVRTTIDTSATANHQVRAALLADNAASIHEKTFVNTDPGNTLEIVAGSGARLDFGGNVVQSGFTVSEDGEFSLGNLQACFEFSGFIYFKIKVVGPPAQQLTCVQTSGNQTVAINTPVSFRTSDNSAGNWTVTDGLVGKANPASANNSATFTPSFNSPGSGTVRVVSGTRTASCPITVTGSSNVGCIDILKETFNTQGTQIFPVAQFTFHLSGTTQTAVNDADGHARFSNVTPGTYQVTEDVTTNWALQSISPVNVIVSAGSTCAGVTIKNKQILNQQTLVCSPPTSTFPQGTAPTVTFHATGGNGVYEWSTGAGLPHSGSGSSFTASFPAGNPTIIFTVKVTSGGQSAECQINFIGNPPPPPQQSLTCTGTIVASTGTTTIASFTANAVNITAPLTWTLSPDGVLSSTTGDSVTATFTTPGLKTATVTARGGPSAQCSVNVIEIPPPHVDFTCSGSIISSNSSQTVATFTVNAVNVSGPFTWTLSPDGVLSSSTGNSVQATFTTSGTKTATVHAPNGLTANCSVQVNQVSIVDCSPSSQSANIGQTVFFSAIGTGTLTWSAPGSTKLTGTGPTFNTSYTNNNPVTKTVTVSNGTSSDTCLVIVNPENTGTLNILKQVRNKDRGSSFSKQTNAESGERVEYKVTVTASNGTVNNVQLSENLPSHLTLVNGSGRLDGQTISDNFINNFISLGNMTSGTSSDTRILTFEARAFAASGQSRTTIINTATVFGTNVDSLSDSATVIVNQFTTSGFGELSIDKQVRNLTQNTSLRNSVNANNNDKVQFEIVIRNDGSDTVENVRLTDTVPSSLDVDTNSIDANGLEDDNSSGNRIDLKLGDLRSGQSRRIRFDARVTTSSITIENIARATGDGVDRVEDNAFVFVNNTSTGNPNLVFSKRAHNDTKNVDATSVQASREDFITYTLTVTNNGNATANNFVITDDLSGVLPFADMVDNGGGTLSGNVISFPGVDIPAGHSASKSFRVRVKFSLPAQQTFVMSNTYGNTVTITIGPKPGVPRFIAPTTGAGATTAMLFGGMLTAAFAVVRRRKSVWNFIWN